MKLTDMPDNPWHILVMGGPKTGKTQLIGSLCQLVPTVVVTADPIGLDTLRSMHVDPEVILLDDWGKAYEAYERLEALAKTHRAIALDDLGSSQAKIRTRILHQPQGKDEYKLGRNELGQQIDRQLMLGGRRLQLQGYGAMATGMNTFMEAFLRLPYRIKVITVLEELREHPRSGENHLFPALEGSLRYELPARFSLVSSLWLHQVDGTTYFCGTTRPHPHIPTGTRYGAPRTWINPDMSKLLKSIQGKEEVADQETKVEQAIGTGLLSK